MKKTQKHILAFIGNDYCASNKETDEIISWGLKLKKQTKSELHLAAIGDKNYIESIKNKTTSICEIDKLYTSTVMDLIYFDDTTYSECLYETIKQCNPSIVIGLATDIGRALFPRVAASLTTGLTADCTQLNIGPDGFLIQTRPAYGGNIMAEIICQTARPQMATVRSGHIKPMIKHNKSQQVECIEIYPTEPKIFTNKLIKAINTSNTNSLSNAKIIIGVGKGIKKKENISFFEQFAKSINATIGTTRACVEAGWFPYEKQIGLTGQTVAPKLYIACGISGTIQHMTGILNAEKIIAINKDKNAPIFNYADIAITKDMFDIIPRITTEIKKYL